MIIKIIIYLILSNAGLVLMKIGSPNSKFGVSNGVFAISLSYQMVIGALFYIASFLLYVYLLSKLNLSYIAAVFTGASYLIATAFAVFFFHEKIGLYQIIGMSIIFVGIIFMNLK